MIRDFQQIVDKIFTSAVCGAAKSATILYEERPLLWSMSFNLCCALLREVMDHISLEKAILNSCVIAGIPTRTYCISRDGSMITCLPLEWSAYGTVQGLMTSRSEAIPSVLHPELVCFVFEDGDHKNKGAKALTQLLTGL